MGGKQAMRWRARGCALLLLAAAMACGPALPAEIPSQATWTFAKRLIALPNGQSLAVVEVGDAGLPPVLLVHGYGDNSRSFSLLAPHLADRFRLLAVDLRGHGASSAPECCYALSELAYDLRLVLDVLQIERASLVGHGLGGMLGQVFAARWPERLDRLALIASAPSMSEAAARDGWLWEQVHALEAPIEPGGGFMQERYATPGPVDPDFLERQMAESAAVPAHVWRSLLYELQVTEPGRVLWGVEAPTLILWGEEDALVDRADQDQLRAALPEATFGALPGLGHNPHWEDPAGLAAAIGAFLQP
jgi:pimeloyl-ACP methyl ester carboxylesterase